jgi:GT2 family glycosyltransferase
VCRHAPPGTEILVVDDASPDAVIERTVSAFSGVSCHRLSQRSGFCVAANAGIARTSGDVVEVLNDDTEVSPGWADAACSAFAPDVGAVTPLVLMGPPGTHDPERVDSAGDEYHLAGVASKRGHGERLSARHLRAQSVFAANGTGSFYRREALLEVGGFPEAFVAYFDDIDLSFPLRRAGWRILYEPAARLHHRVSSSYGAPSGELLALQSRNEELVFWRNLPLPVLLGALPLHLAVLGGKALRRWREGQLGPFLRGRAQALWLWREVLEHRRHLPGRASVASIRVGSWAVPPRAAPGCAKPPPGAKAVPPSGLKSAASGARRAARW